MTEFLSRACDRIAPVNRAQQESAAGRLGIVITAVGPEFLCAEMPVDEHTRQPFGILHGGASMVLAETLGSVASWLLVRDRGGMAAGIEINGCHLKSVSSGVVTGVCTPLRVGTNLHFWRIQIRDVARRLCGDARLTVAIQWPRNADRRD